MYAYWAVAHQCTLSCRGDLNAGRQDARLWAVISGDPRRYDKNYYRRDRSFGVGKPVCERCKSSVPAAPLNGRPGPASSINWC